MFENICTSVNFSPQQEKTTSWGLFQHLERSDSTAHMFTLIEFFCFKNVNLFKRSPLFKKRSLHERFQSAFDTGLHHVSSDIWVTKCSERDFQAFPLFSIPMNSTPTAINRIIATGFNRRKVRKCWTHLKALTSKSIFSRQENSTSVINEYVKQEAHYEQSRLGNDPKRKKRNNTIM